MWWWGGGWVLILGWWVGNGGLGGGLGLGFDGYEFHSGLIGIGFMAALVLLWWCGGIIWVSRWYVFI